MLSVILEENGLGDILDATTGQVLREELVKAARPRGRWIFAADVQLAVCRRMRLASWPEW